MGILRIRVSNDLIEQLLSTGYDTNGSLKCTNGLPKCSKLVQCQYDDYRKAVDLLFENKEVEVGKIIDIDVSMERKEGV